MNHKNIQKLLLLIIIFFSVIGFSKPAQAVMPPDFVFNIGYQIAQIFSLLTIFLSAILSVFYQFIKIKLTAFSLNKWHWVASIIIILAIAGGVAYFYGQYEQKIAYDNWLTESQKYNEQTKEVGDYETIDKLKISAIKNVDIQKTSNGAKFSSNITQNLNNDKSAQFIQDYYGNIANHALEKAYAMSKKVVDLQTFKNWYKDTNKITLDNLTRIDDKKSSLELTLYESDKYTRYGVLMTLLIENKMPVQVEKSEVRILEQGAVMANLRSEPNQAQEEKITTGFFTDNENYPIFISNNEFQTIINNNRNNYLVLDARENIEYENGFFPDSIHIRFADLQAGRWIEIPNDKFVYVLCWSGIRGKEVAEFLRTKDIVASYLENGANGWVEYGGQWIGSVKFSAKYSEERYRLVFNTTDVKEKVVRENIQLVDSREPWKYEQAHLPGSISFPIMYTPTTNLEGVFSQFKPNSKVIIICDGYVNCFDAKITGVELEAKGHQLLGRYNKPWEY
ncbi:MAG: hypothetical protein A3H70_04295 [Candidatus Komeilibacteria bacterium RIFCSPLOWO2_02_FULL_48_11]|uniref:Rhodanese domain-containing protein n=1 Tax=Candidatus Komeilibacteria bacterium RIFCSPLOWO2_02_FULL_48_11 TaxID=1798553 RepID=A0A1G2BPN9_9BACT|nr:MAG: hypothetical protein A3H70_04295 [Candidatus Komeilibacteria bacterium RIFCSPLOWO2_02_FULL_48_11]